MEGAPGVRKWVLQPQVHGLPEWPWKGRASDGGCARSAEVGAGVFHVEHAEGAARTGVGHSWPWGAGQACAQCIASRRPATSRAVLPSLSGGAIG